MYIYKQINKQQHNVCQHKQTTTNTNTLQHTHALQTTSATSNQNHSTQYINKPIKHNQKQTQQNTSTITKQ